MAAELIVTTVLASFAKLGKHLEAWYDLMAAMDKLGVLVDLPLERVDGEGYREPEGVGAAMRVRGLCYGYDEHREVLHGLDLELAPGERVALVGPSGSGKSTLVDLIYGLRAPTRGAIELDGLNTRDLRLEAIRSRVALVKGPEVVEGTIIDNVRLGRHWLPLADVRHALEAVGLMDEVFNLPDGMYTRLTSAGNPLSRGQARRLMIARAMAGAPRLMLVDEGLDGLDLDAREEVIAALFDPSAPWTLLIVTHGHDVAERCDRLIGMARGRAERSLVLADGRGRELAEWLRETRSCRPE